MAAAALAASGLMAVFVPGLERTSSALVSEPLWATMGTIATIIISSLLLGTMDRWLGRWTD